MTSVATVGKDMLNTKPDTFPSKEYEQLFLMLFSFINYKQHIEVIGMILVAVICNLTCRYSSLIY